MADRLIKIMDEVNDNNLLDFKTIEKRLTLPDSDVRLHAILNIRHLVESNRRTNELFNLAAKHVTDSDNDCRWQAIIIIGQFLKTRQQDIWKIIMTFGSSQDSDMRTAIATVLLEHFFEENINLFDKYISDIRQEIENGNTNLKDTLSLCRFNFIDNEKIRQIHQLLTD